MIMTANDNGLKNNVTIVIDKKDRICSLSQNEQNNKRFSGSVKNLKIELTYVQISNVIKHVEHTIG